MKQEHDSHEIKNLESSSETRTTVKSRGIFFMNQGFRRIERWGVTQIKPISLSLENKVIRIEFHASHRDRAVTFDRRQVDHGIGA